MEKPKYNDDPYNVDDEDLIADHLAFHGVKNESTIDKARERGYESVDEYIESFNLDEEDKEDSSEKEKK